VKMCRKVWIIACVLGVCGSAGADDVQIRKLKYHDVTVVSTAKGEIRFRMPNRHLVAKPITDVTFISIEGESDFNAAERLLVERKFAEAVESYDRALRDKSGWLATLIRYRRLVALNEARMIDRATEEWLVLAGESGAKEILKLRPSKFPPEGSKQNTSAIALLTQTRKRIGGNELYAAAVDQLLLELCQYENMKSAATVLAEEILTTRAGGGDGNVRLDPATADAQLRAMAILITAGQCEQVLQDIQKNLRANAYGTEQLPRAILLAGQAQQRMADDAKDTRRRKLLIAAGLDFMRVATFFPGSDCAAEAMLHAGEINASLGNSWAARNAWGMVIKNYPSTPTAETAAASIQAMEKTSPVEDTDALKGDDAQRKSVTTKETAK